MKKALEGGGGEGLKKAMATPAHGLVPSTAGPSPLSAQEWSPVVRSALFGDAGSAAGERAADSTQGLDCGLLADVREVGGLMPVDAATSKAGLKAYCAQMWRENERRRAAMLQLFSKHTELAPDSAAGALHVHDLSRGVAGFTAAGLKRRCVFRPRGSNAELELDQLPDSLLSYIYGFAPKQVCRDLAVSKRFRRCLTKVDKAILIVQSGMEVTVSSLMRFEHGVQLVGKRCWGLSQVLTSALAAGWSALVALDLSDNELNDEATKHLSVALSRNSTNLTSLCLCDNNITAVGAQCLGQALGEFKRLEKLLLTGNRIGQDGSLHLADGLERQHGVATRLTHLGLGGNSIGVRGVEALMPVFMPPRLVCDSADTAAGCSSGGLAVASPGRRVGAAAEQQQSRLPNGGVLQKLDFSACSLGPVGMRALAPLLAWNTNLRELSLSRNDLEVGGAQALARVVPSSLTELNLNFNNLGVEGARAIAPALVRMRSLTHLKLFGNVIGESGAQVLLPVLEELTSLSSLYLSLNNIDAKSKSMMSGVLKRRLRTFHI